MYFIPVPGGFLRPLLDKFCYFCTTFIPLPDSSVTSVTTSYRYSGMGYTFHLSYSYPGEVYDFCTTSYPTRGRFMTSVQHHALPESYFHTLTRQFCDFCNNFVPLPGYGVCLSYPYLEDFCDFCTTLYPTRQVLWLLYDFHTLTWQFCYFCNKSHTLQKVPVPYRTQPLKII